MVALIYKRNSSNYATKFGGRTPGGQGGGGSAGRRKQGDRQSKGVVGGGGWMKRVKWKCMFFAALVKSGAQELRSL